MHKLMFKSNLPSLLVLLFSFFVQLIVAQDDYRDGYIITNKGDTVTGQIAIRDNTSNNFLCEFRKDSEHSFVTYRPFIIRAYSVMGRYYISKEISWNDETKEVFLEYLVDGEVDLYFFQNNHQLIYFLENDTSMFALTNDEHTVTKGSKSYIKNSNQYIGIMNYMFQDAHDILAKTRQTSFDSKSLIKITENYHNSVCDDYECIVYAKSTKIKWAIEPELGYKSSWLSINKELSKSMSNVIRGGLNFHFRPSSASLSWNFITGVNLNKITYASKYNHHLSTGYYFRFLHKISFVNVQVPIIAEYNYLISKIKLFIAFGYTNNILIDSSHEVFDYDVNNSSNVQAQHLIEKVEMRNYHNGLLFYTGIHYPINRKVYVQLKLNGSFQYNPLQYYRIYESGLYLSLGYSVN